MPEEQEREATELMGRVKARLAQIKLIEGRVDVVPDAAEIKEMGDRDLDRDCAARRSERRTSAPYPSPSSP